MRVVECTDHLTIDSAAIAFVAFAAGGTEAASWLSSAEARYVSRLVAPVRRASWLAGRLAAKTAVCELLGADVPLSTIEILPAATGVPLVHTNGYSGQRPVAVSISHTHNLAVAQAYDRQRWSAGGIDIEAREQTLDPSLMDLAFSEHECAAIDAARSPSERHLTALRFWTAKEAALKAVHRGLRLPLNAVRLFWCDSRRPSEARVELPSGVRIQCELHPLEYPGHVATAALEKSDAR